MIEVNKVYLMDCLEGMKLIDDNSVDLIITDPPYFVREKIVPEKKNIRSFSRKSSENSVFSQEWDIFKGLKEYKGFILNCFNEFDRILRDKGQIYMFFSFKHINWIINLIIKKGFVFYRPLIFYKPDVMGIFPNQYGYNYEFILWFRKWGKQNNVVLNIGCSQRDVFTYRSTLNSYRKECGFHPTPKPIGLIRTLIKNGSSENDLILDPFMGSGTTAVGCKQLNRRFIGFENKKEYVNICDKRLEQNNLKRWF